MSGFFGGDTPEVVPAPAPPSRSDAEVQAAALAARQRRAGAAGRASTILTSGQGVTDEIETEPTTLLGGA